MKYFAIILGVIIIVGLGTLFFIDLPFSSDVMDNTPEQSETVDTSPETTQTDEDEMDEPEVTEQGPIEVIGTSAGGEEIRAYHFGEGNTEVLFVGGTHGGYSFNTAALGYELVDYFDENLNAVPDGMKVTIIPVLNPDGLKEIVGTTGRFDTAIVTTNDEDRVAGRFNANEVDINRNFDCEWKTTGTWQNRSVSGGSTPFSEAESKAVRDYVTSHGINAAVVYYSQAGGVYSSTCSDTVSAETAALTNTYAQASGYPAYEEFDYYEITGDMVNWMAKEGVPAISVLLTDHENVEWNKNKAGVEAILKLVANNE